MGQPARQGPRHQPTTTSSPATRVVSVAQMQQIDEAAIHHGGIPRLLLMEHAGLALARAVIELGPAPSANLLICCGTGYNGGDGLCAAWHLRRQGYRPQVVVTGALQQLREEPAIYARIVKAFDLPLIEVRSVEDLVGVERACAQAAVIIDAVLGIGVVGPVRPLAANLIRLMNASKKPIVSADVPSGLNADTGFPQGVAVRATITVTFGLPKQGLALAEGPQHVGKLLVDDLGIPASVLQVR